MELTFLISLVKSKKNAYSSNNAPYCGCLVQNDNSSNDPCVRDIVYLKGEHSFTRLARCVQYPSLCIQKMLAIQMLDTLQMNGLVKK